MLQVFKAAQPALLYLVPFTLIPLFGMAWMKVRFLIDHHKYYCPPSLSPHSKKTQIKLFHILRATSGRCGPTHLCMCPPPSTRPSEEDRLIQSSHVAIPADGSNPYKLDFTLDDCWGGGLSVLKDLCQISNLYGGSLSKSSRFGFSQCLQNSQVKD